MGDCDCYGFGPQKKDHAAAIQMQPTNISCENICSSIKKEDASYIVMMWHFPELSHYIENKKRDSCQWRMRKPGYNAWAVSPRRIMMAADSFKLCKYRIPCSYSKVLVCVRALCGGIDSPPSSPTGIKCLVRSLPWTTPILNRPLTLEPGCGKEEGTYCIWAEARRRRAAHEATSY